MSVALAELFEYQTLPQTTLDEAIMRITQEGARSIVNHGGVRFAVVPIEDAEYMEDIEDEIDARAIREMRSSNEPFVKWEDLKARLDKKHGIHA